MMTKIPSRWWAVALLVFVSTACNAAKPQLSRQETAVSGRDRPPNVILFYADDLGAGDVGCYGCRDIRTPNLDALAKRGVRFTNYYAAAPICAPSRAALMTGRYPMRIGMSSQKNIGSGMEVEGIPGSEVTVAEVVKSRGYATALYGKWHLGSTSDSIPNAQGFDEFFGFHASCIDSLSHMYYASEPWYHDLYHNREEVFVDGIHMTDLITREATAFIRGHARDPFLIYVAYNAPHYPMVPQSRFVKAYSQMPEPRRSYAAMVTGLDDSVGAIIRVLEENKILDQTFIFFASDNGAPSPSKRGEGGGSNAPYREHKRSLFDGGMHSPGIVSWPQHIPQGQTRDQLAIAMDVLPTVAEITGAPLPKDVVLDGRSWAPLFRDPAAPGHERLFFEWAGQHVVREGDWKLVENGLVNLSSDNRNNRVKGEDSTFLSNVKDDVNEKVNRRSQHPDLARKMSEAHKQWLAQFPKVD